MYCSFTFGLLFIETQIIHILNMEMMTSPVNLSTLNYGWTDFLCVQTVYGSYPVTLHRRKIIDLYVTLLLVRLQIFIINPVFNQFNFIEFEGFSLSCFLLTVVPVIICPVSWERGRIRVYWGYWGHISVVSSVETLILPTPRLAEPLPLPQSSTPSAKVT